jgi:hypothetical protein
MARTMPRDVMQVTASDNRNPDMLPPGSVLVVGASATGRSLPRRSRASGAR